MHISSSYAKILGEKLFRTWEIPRSGSKAEDGGKKKRRKRRERGAKVGENNGQATHGAHKPPGPIVVLLLTLNIMGDNIRHSVVI